MPTRWPLPTVSRPSIARTPDAERLGDAAAVQRARRRAGDFGAARVDDRAEAVERAAQAVEHAAEQPVGEPDLQRLAERDDLVAGRDPAQLAERHQQDLGVAEADRFGQHRLRGALDSGSRRSRRSPSAGRSTRSRCRSPGAPCRWCGSGRRCAARRDSASRRTPRRRLDGAASRGARGQARAVRRVGLGERRRLDHDVVLDVQDLARLVELGARSGRRSCRPRSRPPRRRGRRAGPRPPAGCGCRRSRSARRGARACARGRPG